MKSDLRTLDVESPLSGGCLRVAALICCAIGGCGGGSSGGGGAPPALPQPPPTPTATLRIDEDNAEEVGARVFDAIELAESGNDIVFDTLYRLVDNQLMDVVRDCSRSGTVTSSLNDADSSASVSVRDVVTTTLANCNGQTGEVSLTISAVIANQSDFRQLDGSVAMDISFMNATISASVQESHSMRSSDTGIRSLLTSDATITNTIEDTASEIGEVTDRTTELTVRTTLGANDDYEVSISGRMDSDALGGRFNFETRLPFEGALGNHPDDGVLYVSGLESSVEFTANASPYRLRRVANYRVDSTGDGIPGPTMFIPWPRLVIGVLFGVVAPFDPRADRPFNQAPYITDVYIEPESPGTTDPVTVVAETIDPEGAALDIAYAWFRNGELLSGRAARTLPPHEYAKGDMVSVEVTADDGSLSSSLRRDFTIGDTPPVLSLLSEPPAAISAGELVSFQVGLTDVDDDPIPQTDFRIDHGPAGMEVDPNGRVSWTPAGPRFDRSMEFNWGISASEFDGTALSGVIQVEFPDATYPLLRTGVLIHLGEVHTGVHVNPEFGDFAFGDFDSDGTVEILIANKERAVYELDWNGNTFEQTWAYPYRLALEDLLPAALDDDGPVRNSSSVTAVANGDVDGDGLHEIFLAAEEIIAKLDGEERRVSAVAALDSQFECLHLEFVDMESDGDAELVCITGRGYGPAGYAIFVLDPVDLAIEARERIDRLGEWFAVANVDHDTALEIIDSGGRVFDGATFALEWFYRAGFSPNALSQLEFQTGDIDGNGISEIVAIDRADLRIFSAVSRSVVLESRFDSGLQTLHVADIDDDGVDEIIVRTGSIIAAHRFSPSTASLDTLFEVDLQAFGEEYRGAHWLQHIGIGDVDGDGAREFIWAQESAVAITGLNPDFEVEWSGHGTHDFAGPFSGGETATLGSGDRSLVFSGFGIRSHAAGRDGGPRLLIVDPATGRYRVTPHDIGEQRYAPIAVSDFDLDGVDDVFLSTRYDDEPYFTVQGIVDDQERWRSSSIAWDVAEIENEDVTGDGRDELIALTTHHAEGARIRVYDIARETLTWESDRNHTSFTLADLDADGVRELIAGTENRTQPDAGVAVYRQNGEGGFEQVAFVDLDTDLIRDVVAGDTDGDGEIEIFALDFGGDGPIYRLNNELELVSRLETSGDINWIYLGPSGARRRNLILAEHETFDVGGGPRLYGVDAFTGGEVWRSPLLLELPSGDSLHYVDSNGDGELEMVLGMRYGIMITR